MLANIKKKGKTYPTLWDKGGKVCRAFGIIAYPTAYLLGVDGKVIWEGNPGVDKKSIAKYEKLIEGELEKVAASRKKASRLTKPLAKKQTKSTHKEPQWLTAKTAFARAQKDGRWVLVYKDWPL